MYRKVAATLSFVLACHGGSNTPSDAGLDAEAGAPEEASLPDADVLDASAEAGTIDSSIPDSCIDVTITPAVSKLSAQVIVDRSGSMGSNFGSSTRWQVLKDTILAPTGVVATYQNRVSFGLSMYSGQEGGQCPIVDSVLPALGNLSAITALYSPANPLWDTPTGEAVSSVTAALEAHGSNLAETIYILATDGEPDTCAVPNPQRGQPEAIASVQAAFAKGIRTYIIAVADERELSQTHIQDMANAGLGVTSGAPSFRVSNDTGLRQAIETILGGEISCDVDLGGQATGDYCTGSVSLNGVVLKCNQDWSLKNPTTMSLTGQACTQYRTGEKLEVHFPCGEVILR